MACSIWPDSYRVVLTLPVATKQRLSAIVELADFTQPFTIDTSAGRPVGRANTLDLLFVGTETTCPNLILDLSFDHGFTSTSTHWEAGFGFTYLLPQRLWPEKHPVSRIVGASHFRA